MKTATLILMTLALIMTGAGCDDPPVDDDMGAGGVGGAPDGGDAERCDHPRSTCRDDADCPGGRCGAVPDDPAAPCLCIGPAPAPVLGACSDGQLGECCDDTGCADGLRCHQQLFGPQNEYCGGPEPFDDNICRGDTCQTDDDCGAAQICVPAGAFGFVFATCQTAHCRTDADCAARPGGECRPYFTPCQSAALGCSYADDPCRVDADCPPDGPQIACIPRPGEGTACVEYFPPP